MIEIIISILETIGMCVVATALWVALLVVFVKENNKHD